MKKYEVECQRTNVTPKAFFEYCRKQAAKKGLDIECWTDFENWVNPLVPEEFHTYKHETWEVPAYEAVKYMPYDLQMYLEKTYNFIMEFEFDTETKGHGYMYAMEFAS